MRWKFLLCVLFLVALIVLSACLLASSYDELRTSVQDERVDAVSEISAQISYKITLTRDACIAEIEQIAQNLMLNTGLDTDRAKVLLGDQEATFLILLENGSIEDLSGKSYVMREKVELLERLQTGNTATMFSTFEGYGDQWLFATPSPGLVIDGKNVVAVAKRVNSQVFADSAVVSLYDGMGASYVLTAEGVILMRPSSAQGDAIMTGGYNLFSTFEENPETAAAGAQMRKDFAVQRAGQLIVQQGGVQWLLQYTPVENEERVLVVAVPISMTAASTYAGLDQTIIRAALLIFTMAATSLFIITFLIRRNQKNKLAVASAQAKNNFLDKMSHDIRTPLNAIIGMHQIAMDSIDDKAVVYDCLNKAKTSSDYLVSVINDVLDMSKIESGKMELAKNRFSMSELLESVRVMAVSVAAEKDIDFAVRFENAIETDFIGDAVRLRQCLMNLLSNAVKFTPQGGSVSLSYRETVVDETHRIVRIAVQDSGIGMGKDYLSRIFNPFEQEQSSLTALTSGSGLGLAIVKSIVDLMDGSISVQSQVGKGSRFTLELPFEVTDKVIESPVSSDEVWNAERLRNKTILLVEDHPVNRQIIANLLTKRGLLVEEALNGKEAYEQFMASTPGHLSLILMDIKMPVMDGLEATRCIRQSPHADAKTIPIIALSANAFEEDARKSLAAGMQAHIAKPLDVDALTRLFDKYL